MTRSNSAVDGTEDETDPIVDVTEERHQLSSGGRGIRGLGIVEEVEGEVYPLRRNRTREGQGQISFFSSFLSFS